MKINRVLSIVFGVFLLIDIGLIIYSYRGKLIKTTNIPNKKAIGQAQVQKNNDVVLQYLSSEKDTKEGENTYSELPHDMTPGIFFQKNTLNLIGKLVTYNKSENSLLIAYPVKWVRPNVTLNKSIKLYLTPTTYIYEKKGTSVVDVKLKFLDVINKSKGIEVQFFTNRKFDNKVDTIILLED